MSVRNWPIFFTSNIRYIITIILLSTFFFLFNSILSSHQFTIASTQKFLINETVSEDRLPYTNHTIRFAVVSALYNENYIKGVEVLGYSLRRVNIQADLILFYISNRLNQSILDRCRNAGWYLWSVKRIDPPRFAIIYPRFIDQYTKLRIWSMIGYEKILYLDADTLVLRDINQLFTQTIFEDNQEGFLGAVEDVWQGQLGPNFNAGVLLIHPNMTIFEDMLVKMHNMAAYGTYWAEQGFLNWYFKGSTGRLPLVYNFNNVLAIYHRDIYFQLRTRIKIIHYTSDKPFSITKSNPVFFELWNIWHQIHNEMLNQTFV